MLIQEAKRLQKLAGLITEDMEEKVPSRLSPQEQAVYDDLTNSLDESMGGFIEKFKSYLKKGAITVALVASLLSNQATAIPIEQSFKEMPPIELVKFAKKFKEAEGISWGNSNKTEEAGLVGYAWWLSGNTPTQLQHTGAQLAQYIVPIGSKIIDPEGGYEQFNLYWLEFNESKETQKEIFKNLPQSIGKLEQFMKTHDSNSSEVKQVLAAIMRLQSNSNQVKGIGDIGKIKSDLKFLIKTLGLDKNEIANYIGYKTNSTAAKMAFKVMFENKNKI